MTTHLTRVEILVSIAIKLLSLSIPRGGTIVYFESRVPTEWEKTHLPIILLTNEDWNPSQEMSGIGDQSREFKEMRTIQSLTTGLTKRQINAIRQEEARGVRPEDSWVQSARPDLELQHGMIPCTLSPRDFTKRLLSAVNIATAYREDIDQLSEQRRASGVISNERHSVATPEDLAQLWNIGLQTAKNTVRVTTQKGIRVDCNPSNDEARPSRPSTPAPAATKRNLVCRHIVVES